MKPLRLEIFGVVMLIIITGLFSGIYHMFVQERDQLQLIHTNTATTASGIIGIQLRLKILESALLNFDYETQPTETE